MGTLMNPKTIELLELKKNQQGLLVNIKGEQLAIALAARGLYPGATVTMIQNRKKGALIIASDRTFLALDFSICSSINVHLKKTEPKQ